MGANRWSMGLLLAGLVAGCGEPGDRPNEREDAVAWTETDRPDRLDGALEYLHTALPLEGEVAQVPWAASHWPAWRDGINDRWAGAGELSPAEKYAAAFSAPGVPDALSATSGVGAAAGRVCAADTDCDATVGERCALRRTQTEGHCMAAWAGMGHGAAAAALALPEPAHAVTRGGITFRINDLKALATALYAEAPRRQIALACTAAEDPACADANAGAFHVALTNFIGLRGEGVVLDRDLGPGVQSRAVRGYHVLMDEPLDAAHAVALGGGSPGTVAAWRHVRVAVFTAPEDASEGVELEDSAIEPYEYLLELDAEGRITGGTWLGQSVEFHPDFLWVPAGAPPAEVARSPERRVTTQGTVGRDGWVAAAEVPVQAGERIVARLSGSGDADLYLRLGDRPWADRFDCASRQGGMEETCSWVAPRVGKVFVHVRGRAARSSWRLEVMGERAGSGLRRDAVTSLLAEAAGNRSGDTELRMATEGGWVEAKAWRHLGPFRVESGTFAATLATLDPEGDADLFVRVGAPATLADFDCRSRAAGQAEDACLVTGGLVYVGVYGRRAGAWQLSMRYLPAPQGSVPEPPAARTVLETDRVAKSGWRTYGPFAVTDGALEAALAVSRGDADLFVRAGEPPTPTTYDCSPRLEGQATERCVVQGRQVFVAVAGHEDSDFELALRFEGLTPP